MSPECITSERSERLTFLEEWSEDLELTEVPVIPSVTVAWKQRFWRRNLCFQALRVNNKEAPSRAEETRVHLNRLHLFLR